MPPFRNLVSDSTLVQETIDLLRDCGGRAAASEIVDSVFKISHIDADLASLLVADLVRDDLRFKVLDGYTIELLTDNLETTWPVCWLPILSGTISASKSSTVTP